MEPVLEPREHRAGPSWWAGPAFANDARNALFWERKIAEGAEGAESGYFHDQFLQTLKRYAAGESLEKVVDTFRSILVPWSTCITRPHLSEYDKRFPSLAHLCGVPEIIENLDYPHPGPSYRPRFAGWLLGDRGALDSDDYVDPEDPLLLDNVRVELVRVCQTNPEAGRSALEHYVREQWYPGSQQEGWYGTDWPNRQGEYWGYSGYWCWEAAAIAKILDIDDSGLEGHEYYPYDLAHFLDRSD